MLTSKVAMPDCSVGVRGDVARKHAAALRQTDDKASVDSIIQRISPDVHLPCPATASHLRSVENRMAKERLYS
jgi:hypothetical protein